MSYTDLARAIGRRFADRHQQVVPDTSIPMREARYDAEHAERVARWYWARALDGQPHGDRETWVWDQLAAVISEQYDALLDAGFRHTVTLNDPYETPEQVWHDADRGHLKTFASEPGGHPVWSMSQNDRFRFVHDMLTHFAHRLRFDREGEDMAYRVHRATMPRYLWGALATETRAQNAALNFAPVCGQAAGRFAPQVAVVSPGWVYVP